MHHVLLDHFLASYDARSLGRAAAQLALSQPALSKSIRKLETDLGVPLFERTTSGIVPTPYAHALARRARAIQADLRSSVEELRQLRLGEAGEVRMGVAPALSPHYLPRVVAWAHASHPSLVFAVQEGLYDSLAHGVATGALDFALTNLPFDGLAVGLQAEELFRDHFVVFCGASHPLAQRRSVRAAELLEHPWITPPREGMVWQRLVALFARAKAPPPRPVVESGSASLIKSLLAEGRFLSFVPRQLVLDELMRGDIVELACAGMILERSIAVVARTGHVLPAAAMVALDACRAVALQIPRPRRLAERRPSA